MNRKGFTLIELVVVIGIIAVLAGLILVRISNASLDSRNAKRKNDLNATKQAIDMYQANGGELLLSDYGPGSTMISQDNVCLEDDQQILMLVGPNPDNTGKRILDYLEEGECPKDPKGYGYYFRVIDPTQEPPYPAEGELYYCISTYMMSPGSNPELDYQACF
jgi:prepilin-type N-terminal cleavage/methylation domain-containing protein